MQGGESNPFKLITIPKIFLQIFEGFSWKFYGNLSRAFFGKSALLGQEIFALNEAA